jgi:ATP-dependent Zn protease
VFLGRDYTRGQDLSNEVAAAIDQEVRFLITQAHDEARLIINSHREALDRVAGALIEKETLDASALGEVFHDVPKWEHTESGSLRLKAPKGLEVKGGLAAVRSDAPGSH